jgi:hypothetical protein
VIDRDKARQGKACKHAAAAAATKKKKKKQELAIKN